jgi:hypothetical protein
MSEQVVPSGIVQRIITKSLTNENVKPAEISLRLRAQFGDETLSRTQMYDWSKSCKSNRKEVENMLRLYLVQGKLWLASFGDLRASYFSISL